MSIAPGSWPARRGDLLRELGANVTAARTSDATARIELLAGDAEAAEAKLRADYDALTAMRERYVLPNIAAMLAKTLVELGRLDEAGEIAGIAEGLAADDDVEAQIVLRTVRARLAASAGRADEARLLARRGRRAHGADRRSRPAGPTRCVDVAEALDGSRRRSGSPHSRKRARSTARRRT